MTAALAVAGAVLLLTAFIWADKLYSNYERQHARQQVTHSLIHACRQNPEFC